MLRKLCFPLSLLLLGCCGYSVRALLPPHLKTISVQPVENQTVKPDLDVRLTDLMVQGFTRDGSLRITDLKHADLVLTCKVNGYEKLPQTYDASQLITTWRITLQAQVEAQDQVKSQSLWTGSVPVTVNYAATETEELGLDRALSKLSSEIIRRTLIAW
jgi:hypothetical protein